MTNVVWHPHENIVSFVTSDGELFIYADFLQADFTPLLAITLQPAPFIHDPLAKTNGNAQKSIAKNSHEVSEFRGRRRGTPDSLDDILGPELGDEDDFVSDDDGAGYVNGINGNGKRGNGHLDSTDDVESKRRATYQGWQSTLHQSFQPGSTPWRGNRKYLCEKVYHT